MSLLAESQRATASAASERTPLLPLAGGTREKDRRDRDEQAAGRQWALLTSLFWRSVLVFLLASLLCVALLYFGGRYVLSATPQVLKPSTDRRVYHYLQLSNALPVLLISDSATLVSAAAMSVGIGFYNDPSSVPGLAHFTEHMVGALA